MPIPIEGFTHHAGTFRLVAIADCRDSAPSVPRGLSLRVAIDVAEALVSRNERHALLDEARC